VTGSGASVPRSVGQWLERLPRGREADCRLFCIPHAGGAASAFRSWADRLPEHIGLCALQLPGREKRLSEPPYTRFDELIGEAAAALEPNLDRPFALFGHSLGAIIAFELCRFLRPRYAPVHLFVSGCNAADKVKHGVSVKEKSDHDLLGEMRSYDGTPSDVLMDRELMEHALPLLRADLTLAESYVYRSAEPLTCPISVFGGECDAVTTVDGLKVWEKLTTGPFTFRMFPGGHFFINTARDELLNEIARSLRV
jgi:medium-chain acyl-[acyl-carrier-protein] hydrolase